MAALAAAASPDEEVRRDLTRRCTSLLGEADRPAQLGLAFQTANRTLNTLDTLKKCLRIVPCSTRACGSNSENLEHSGHFRKNLKNLCESWHSTT